MMTAAAGGDPQQATGRISWFTEHLRHTTSPQNRQWCLRLAVENGARQQPHACASASPPLSRAGFVHALKYMCV